MNDGLTAGEILVLNHLADAWNIFCKLNNVAENDVDRFMDAIHSAQSIIGLRVARRVNPEIWRNSDE